MTVLEPGVGRAGLQGRVGRRPPAPSRPSCCAPSRPLAARAPRRAPRRPARARHRRRHARADRRRALRRQPLVRADGLRARRGGRARSAPRSPSSPPTSRSRAARASRYVDVETAAELQAACEAEFAARRRAADGRRRRRLPARRGGGDEAQEGPAARRSRSTLERTDDVLTALAAARRPGQTLVGFAAEHGEGAVAYGRDKLARKGLDAVVVNDIARAGHRLRRRRQRGDDRHRRGRARTSPRPSKAEVARAVLDAVDDLRRAARHGIVRPAIRRSD